MTEDKWYLEVLDQKTELFFQDLSTKGLAKHRIVCINGELHDVVKCSLSVIIAMHKNKEKEDLNFKVFHLQKNGRIKACHPTIYKRKKERKIAVKS